jgi:hypothetical protein
MKGLVLGRPILSECQWVVLVWVCSSSALQPPSTLARVGGQSSLCKHYTANPEHLCCVA